MEGYNKVLMDISWADGNRRIKKDQESCLSHSLYVFRSYIKTERLSSGVFIP